MTFLKIVNSVSNRHYPNSSFVFFTEKLRKKLWLCVTFMAVIYWKNLNGIFVSKYTCVARFYLYI